jgi:hypothetical protein
MTTRKELSAIVKDYEARVASLAETKPWSRMRGELQSAGLSENPAKRSDHSDQW